MINHSQQSSTIKLANHQNHNPQPSSTVDHSDYVRFHTLTYPCQDDIMAAFPAWCCGSGCMPMDSNKHGRLQGRRAVMWKNHGTACLSWILMARHLLHMVAQAGAITILSKTVSWPRLEFVYLVDGNPVWIRSECKLLWFNPERQGFLLMTLNQVARWLIHEGTTDQVPTVTSLLADQLAPSFYRNNHPLDVLTNCPRSPVTNCDVAGFPLDIIILWTFCKNRWTDCFPSMEGCQSWIR